MQDTTIEVKTKRVIEEPEIVKRLLSEPRAALLWLPVRLWLGYQWLSAGWNKTDDPGWTEGGTALKAFWEKSIEIPEPPARPAISFEWYRDFIQYLLDTEAYVWFSKLVMYGEILVGIALILGAFTGLAAFMGGFMNWNYLMAGSASTNPLLFVAALGLILAWKVSGYIGLDYFLLPWIGTPWNRDKKQLIIEEHPVLRPPGAEKPLPR